MVGAASAVSCPASRYEKATPMHQSGMGPGVLVVASVLVPMAPECWAESRSFDLPTFDKIAVATGIHADVEVGAPQSVRIDAKDPADFDDLVVEVRDGRLRLEIDSDARWRRGEAVRSHDTISAFISVPALYELQASSGASIEAAGVSGGRLELQTSSGASMRAVVARGEIIEAAASNGASLTVSGACGHLDAQVSSGASMNAAGLACGSVAVAASSGASATVFARDSAVADASSGASIDIHGRPPITDVDSSSGGSVAVRNRAP